MQKIAKENANWIHSATIGHGQCQTIPNGGQRSVISRIDGEAGRPRPGSFLGEGVVSKILGAIVLDLPLGQVRISNVFNVVHYAKVNRSTSCRESSCQQDPMDRVLGLLLRMSYFKIWLSLRFSNVNFM